MAGEAKHAEELTTTEYESEISCVAVFQCGSCFVIFGDTTAVACTNEALRSISLNRVSDSVVVMDDLHTSKEEHDLGSTYTELMCNECKTMVGKMYKTTPRSLDALRDIYTFHVDKITSYQIGSADKGPPVDVLEDFVTPSAHYLYVQLRKSQSVIVTLHHRLQVLEKKQEDASVAVNEVSSASTINQNDNTRSNDKLFSSHPKKTLELSQPTQTDISLKKTTDRQLPLSDAESPPRQRKKIKKRKVQC